MAKALAYGLFLVSIVAVIYSVVITRGDSGLSPPSNPPLLETYMISETHIVYIHFPDGSHFSFTCRELETMREALEILFAAYLAELQKYQSADYLTSVPMRLGETQEEYLERAKVANAQFDEQLSQYHSILGVLSRSFYRENQK